MVPFIKSEKTQAIITLILLPRAMINYVPHALVKIYLVAQLVLLSITMKQAM